MRKTLPFIGMLFLALASCVNTVKAQYYFYDENHYDSPMSFEIGGSIGAMNCLTDLGGRKGPGKAFVKDLNMGKTNVCGGVFLSATYKSAIGLRLEATFGKVSADDAVLKNVAPSTSGRYERNLSFRSKITEISLVAEIHPLFLMHDYYSDNDFQEDKNPPRFSPYLLGGVGYFSFNPQAQLGNTWVDLQPLHTEGQGFAEYPNRKPYNLQQLNIPLGLGVRYNVSDAITVRGEFVYRKLNTDYLDDVSTNYIDNSLFSNYLSGSRLSNALLLNDRQALNPNTHIDGQRGNPKKNDAYFTFNVKASYNFGRAFIRR